MISLSELHVIPKYERIYIINAAPKEFFTGNIACPEGSHFIFAEKLLIAISGKAEYTQAIVVTSAIIHIA